MSNGGDENISGGLANGTVVSSGGFEGVYGGIASGTVVATWRLRVR